MKVSVTATALVLASLAQAATASDLELNQTQIQGRKLYNQHCGVCHTRPTLVSGLYGPELSRDTAGGRQEVVQEIIAGGTPRMPGFKYMFNSEQIAAIASFLSVLPPGHQDVNLPPK